MPQSNNIISNISSTFPLSPQEEDDHQLFFVTSYSDFDKLGKFKCPLRIWFFYD